MNPIRFRAFRNAGDPVGSIVAEGQALNAGYCDAGRTCSFHASMSICEQIYRQGARRTGQYKDVFF